MKHLVRHIILLLLGLACLVLVAIGLAIGTESGSQWLLARLLAQAPAGVNVAAVEGRLADRLILRQVEASWEDGSVAIEELILDLSPWSLPFRQVKINRLATRSMTLRISQSEKDSSGQPLQLAWPELPKWLQDWQVDLDAVSLKETLLKRPEEEDVSVEQLEASVHLQRGRLVLDKLEALSQGHHLDASIEFNLFDPGVKIKAHAVTRDKQKEAAIDINLTNGVPDTIVSGPIRASITVQGQPEHQISGTLQLAEKQLSVSSLQVERAAMAGAITGELSLSLANKPSIRTELDIHRWTLAIGEGPALTVEGQIGGTGDLEALRGHFEITTSGSKWQSGHLAGKWVAAPDSLSVDIHGGDWLGSGISGTVDSAWEQALTIKAGLEVRGLDPAQFSSDWTGSFNLNADLDLLQSGQDLRVDFATAFFDSRLRGIPLQGTAKGQWENGNLVLDSLDLSGDGFVVGAKGSFAERLNLSFDITDLGGVVPGSAGRLSGQGWVGQRDKVWLADVVADIDHLSYDQLSFEDASLSLSHPQPATPARIDLHADKAGYGEAQFQSIEMLLTGELTHHTVNISAGFDEGIMQAAVSGHYNENLWQGTVSNLSINHNQYGDWQLASPFTSQISDRFFELGRLQLNSNSGEVALSGRFRVSGYPEQMDISVRQLPLQLVNPLVSPLSLSGDLDMELACAEDSCRLQAEGLESIQHPDRTVRFEDLRLSGVWDDEGLQAGIAFDLPSDAQIRGKLSSISPRDSRVPLPLDWSLDWNGLPLSGIAELPQQLAITGTLSGRAQGTLHDGWHFSGEGQVQAQKASVTWQDEDLENIDLAIEDANGDWYWHENTLRGTLKLVLENHGQLSADWQLPVPARWPIVPDQIGKVQGHLGGWLSESGLVGILWPEIIQDTRGDFEVDTILEGTWSKPSIDGNVHLLNGGGYMPGPGIQLEEIELAARFDGHQLLLDKFQVNSDPGVLSGDGVITLNGLEPESMSLSVRGENFTLAHLPELQMRVSPELQLAGTKNDLRLTGSIHIPFFLASGREERSPVQTSPDVIVLGRATQESGQRPFTLATRVNLTLGDQVLVKMFGLDAQLSGQLELTGIDPQHFSGKGQINVEQGSFATYGVKLGIEKGRAVYAGGPLDNPAIDILAIKKMGEDKVGVQIRGTAKAPEVKLYSEPAMADTDILSYIVLGRPLNQAGGETDPLMLAAGALLSAGDSAVLRNSLQSQLGIDTIEAESDSGQTNDTVLRLGKYLTPDLYLSYGYALFGQRSEVGLRYHIYKGWEAESKFGLESGADLYYRFEFE